MFLRVKSSRFIARQDGMRLKFRIVTCSGKYYLSGSLSPIASFLPLTTREFWNWISEARISIRPFNRTISDYCAHHDFTEDVPQPRGRFMFNGRTTAAPPRTTSLLLAQSFQPQSLPSGFRLLCLYLEAVCQYHYHSGAVSSHR